MTPHTLRANWSLRTRTLVAIIGCVLFFVALFLAAHLAGEAGEVTSLTLRKLPPSWDYPFGTDWLGRDVLARTLKGLRSSLGVGLTAAACSSVVALVLGLLAALGGRVADGVVSWMVDVALATPHLVLLILISFACGGGAEGVIIAVAATHWPGLTRIIRAEVLQLRQADYVHISRKLGKGRMWIASRHMLPHVVPQFLVGLLLLFPHAILHAAGLTFLGFGQSPHEPAIGSLLAESLRYLSMGLWWLAVAPGLALVVTVKAFDILGNNVRALLDPKTCRL
ncbi:MAG: ABC transporter permease [Desulfovibrio sp.]|nr:ABC transporter permease [Desulfovibrio sp.]